MKKDLIIGRGLSGAILSHYLSVENSAHDIIDLPTLSVSSKIAAGIINPLVLKRLKLVQDFNLFVHSSHDFYLNCEKSWGQSFYHPTNILHVFQSIGELNLWNEKQAHPDYTSFLGKITPNEIQDINASLGLGTVHHTAWLDTESFLLSHLSSFKGKLIERVVNTGDLPKLQSQYQRIFLCTGHRMKDLWPASQKIFTPTRGEVMVIETKARLPEAILHGPVFILPLGNNQYKVGATYHWDILKDIATSEGLNRLHSDLSKIFSGKYTVISHEGGVRPNVKDRKPLLGKLYNNLYSFNGMGSRAALMAPALAKILLDYIKGRQPLPEEYDINRFKS